MKTVLTIVGKPDAGSLTSGLVSAIRQALRDVGAEVGGADWLAPQTACDIEFEGISEEHAEAEARYALGSAPLDLLAQSSTGRAKKLLIADMDSTMINQECLDELADLAGKRDEVSAITEQAMTGELDFEDALKERVGMLAGLDVSALEETYASRIDLMPGSEALVRTMNANGALCILVSGGFTYFTARVANALGFAEHRGNELIIKDGVLTGDVGQPILGRDAKRTSLEAARRRLGLSIAETMAVGDGANDLDMISDAGLGIAYHAKPVVAKAARARVDHSDLTTLLYFQGCPRKAFVNS